MEAAPPTRHGSPREQAITEAEVRHLCRALAPFGTLSRKQLAAVAGADRWRAGSFEAALDTAVASGAIRALPLDFYQDPARLAHSSAGGHRPRAGSADHGR